MSLCGDIVIAAKEDLDRCLAVIGTMYRSSDEDKAGERAGNIPSFESRGTRQNLRT
jgi:hypothetical protein